MSTVAERRAALALWVLSQLKYVHDGAIKSSMHVLAEDALYRVCGFPQTTDLLDTCLARHNLGEVLLQLGGSATVRERVTKDEFRNLLDYLEKQERLEVTRNVNRRATVIKIKQ